VHEAGSALRISSLNNELEVSEILDTRGNHASTNRALKSINVSIAGGSGASQSVSY
jgi:hypothetical protein